MDDRHRNWHWMALGLCLILAGCGGYGGLRRVTAGDPQTTVQELVGDAGNYRVYRAGVGLDNPSGVLFVPRDGGFTVELGTLWRSVDNPGHLRRVLAGLGAPVDWPFYTVELYRILSASGQPIGYLYTGWTGVTVKQLGEDRVWIADLPDPPQFLGGGDPRSGHP